VGNGEGMDDRGRFLAVMGFECCDRTFVDHLVHPEIS